MIVPPSAQYLLSREAWIPGEGYVLLLTPGELEILEDDLRVSGLCSKAVPKVPSALRGKPLLCFVSAARGKFTHIARATAYYPAESGRDKLDIWSLSELAKPVTLTTLSRRMSGPQAWRAKLALKGGHVSGAAFVVLMKALEALDADAYGIAAGLIDARDDRDDDAEPVNARINWAFQRDAVITAMEIAGIPSAWLELPAHAPDNLADDTASIFDSDEDMVSIEDLVILQDADTPGDDWEFVKRQRYAAKMYRDGNTQLTVILANKLDLEKQLGVDLIYYNETYHSVVFVQYKMFRGEDGELGYRVDPQLGIEIARMDSAARELAKVAADTSCDGYRIGSDPFFLKFCSKLIPAKVTGHVPGIYVPLSYWKRLASDPRAKGKRGGTIVFDHTFGQRRLTPSAFTDLVRRGWVGTSAHQGRELLSYLRGALQGQKGVVFAIQSGIEPEKDEEGFDIPTPKAPRKRKDKYPGRNIPRKVWSI
ncbi:hypothetical protein [Gluconobacter kanchanaburiensis]|uniref:Uncharacterized protein n=1 Tax=Gluconobacter kanchanaburiensis NBRC 103587 TaxID=1307948 RepID=A0A511BBK2_9PROT|nr:hypothetical protein [Gluconobacter kanchanaburiensis]MBF0862741.1 hypothetical protein [Gluconobacter kanchanaburiensis]GBR69203.1 hypothetical protein AA103587_1194 [Gluconobacter kanchanaburiensis NBRC 103587]GEK97003.1 hypothetical protein GKA01_22000 [Gluconobacter kanchanaburiensis NBRC 103587]